MIVTPIVSSIVQPIVSPITPPEQRIFITGDGTSVHFRMTNAKSYPDDFEFTVLFTRTTTVTKVLLGTEIGTANFLAVFAPNLFQLRLDSFNVPAVAFTNVDDGKLHTARYKRVAGVITTFFDDVLVATDDNAGAGINQTFSVDELYKNASGLFWKGVTANVTLDDLTTPSNSESWRLDQPFPITTEQSSSGSNPLIYVDVTASTRELFTLIDGDWLADDVVVNGGFDTDTVWVKGAGWSISGGTANIAGNTFSNLTQTVGSRQDIPVLTTFTISNYVSGTINIFVGDSSGVGTTRSADGTFTEIITTASSGGDLFFQTGGGVGFTGSIDNVSERRILEVA